MYTRDSLDRNFTVYAPPRVIVPGFARAAVHNNIQQVWAIARPGSAPQSDGAPHYISTYGPNQMIRGGFLALIPARPKVEMDPTDSSTWQRRYLFS